MNQSRNQQSTHINDSKDYDTKVLLAVTTRDEVRWITTTVHHEWIGEGYEPNQWNEVNTMFFPTEKMMKEYLIHMIETATKALAEMSVPA